MGKAPYRKMYFTLFNRVSDAIRALDAKNSELARNILCAAQQETEELYLEDDGSRAAKAAAQRAWEEEIRPGK